MMAKDIILRILKDMGIWRSLRGKQSNSTGTNNHDLSAEERMTLCNMVVEGRRWKFQSPGSVTTFRSCDEVSFSSNIPLRID